MTKKTKNSSALTMKEMLYAISILSILIAISAQKFVETTNDAKVARLKFDITNIKSVIPAWYMSTGNLSIQGAVSLNATVWKKKNFRTYSYPISANYPKFATPIGDICIVVGFVAEKNGAPTNRLLGENEKIPDKSYLAINLNGSSKNIICQKAAKQIKSANISMGSNVVVR